MKTKRLLLLAAAATLAAAAHADISASTEAINSPLYRPNGVRTRTVSGVVSTEERYWNVEGINNGANADWALLRFDAAGIKADLDTALGAGMWAIGDITLELAQANATWSRDGQVDFAFTPDTTTPILYPDTTLKYDSSLSPASGQLAQSYITSGQYVKRNNGDIDVFSLFAGNAGGEALKSAILAGGLVTIIGNDGDDDVAATWAGKDHNQYAHPRLTVKAGKIPEPASATLLLAGLPLLALRRRR